MYFNVKNLSAMQCNRHLYTLLGKISPGSDYFYDGVTSYSVIEAAN